MKSTVTRRGQTIIPSVLRRSHDIREGMTLEWIDTGETIKVIPLSGNPIESLRGTAKGEQLLDALLVSRRKDRERNE